jgi:hypothetical protein
VTISLEYVAWVKSLQIEANSAPLAHAPLLIAASRFTVKICRRFAKVAGEKIIQPVIANLKDAILQHAASRKRVETTLLLVVIQVNICWLRKLALLVDAHLRAAARAKSASLTSHAKGIGYPRVPTHRVQLQDVAILVVASSAIVVSTSKEIAIRERLEQIHAPLVLEESASPRTVANLCFARRPSLVQ